MKSSELIKKKNPMIKLRFPIPKKTYKLVLFLIKEIVKNYHQEFVSKILLKI